MNWTRGQLKSNAKLMLKKNHVICCVASFLLMLVGQSEGIFSRINFNQETTGDFASGEYVDGFLGYVQANLGGLYGMLSRIFPILAAFVLIALALSWVFDFLVGNVLSVGGCRFYLHNIHSQGELNDLAFGFQNSYWNVVNVMFRRDLFIFLWSLLLIVPGLVKTYSWRLVPYLLADNPQLDPQSALEISREMMDGEKWNAFVLDLSFIPWLILSTVTFGIAEIVWVAPYRDAVNAELYTALKTRRESGYTV